jgi:hypothetical protein
MILSHRLRHLSQFVVAVVDIGQHDCGTPAWRWPEPEQHWKTRDASCNDSVLHTERVQKRGAGPWRGASDPDARGGIDPNRR